MQWEHAFWGIYFLSKRENHSIDSSNKYFSINWSLKYLNETIKTIQNLRSVRDFSDKEISKDDIDKILKSAIRAANASARQNYSIIVVENREILDRLFYKANKGLLFCIDFTRLVDTAKELKYDYNPNNMWEYITGSTDTILAAQTAAIAAKSLGIDSLFTNSIHRAELSKVYELFNLPKEYCFPLIALCLGYAKCELPYKKGRLTAGVIHYEKHRRITSEDVANIVKQYNDYEKERLGLSPEKYKEIGVKDYFEFFYTKWSRPRNPQKLEEIHKTLLETKFFPS
ncbi:MAG: nitroreductase [Asgard group archaeon]|nr:nitroreductase [Asgard group archaeon]